MINNFKLIPTLLSSLHICIIYSSSSKSNTRETHKKQCVQSCGFSQTPNFRYIKEAKQIITFSSKYFLYDLKRTVKCHIVTHKYKMLVLLHLTFMRIINGHWVYVVCQVNEIVFFYHFFLHLDITTCSKLLCHL